MSFLLLIFHFELVAEALHRDQLKPEFWIWAKMRLFRQYADSFQVLSPISDLFAITN